MPKTALKKKSINPYSGSGSNYTYDQSKTSPKSASANKYSTISTPKSKSNQQKVSNEYQSEINKMRSTVRAYEPKASTGRKPTKSGAYLQDDGRYNGQNATPTKKAVWFTPASRVQAGRYSDESSVEQIPATKKASAYQQYLNKKRKESSKTTAMANGRRTR